MVRGHRASLQLKEHPDFRIESFCDFSTNPLSLRACAADFAMIMVAYDLDHGFAGILLHQAPRLLLKLLQASGEKSAFEWPGNQCPECIAADIPLAHELAVAMVNEEAETCTRFEYSFQFPRRIQNLPIFDAELADCCVKTIIVER